MDNKVAIVKFKEDSYSKSYAYKVPDYISNIKVGDYAVVPSQYGEFGYSIVKVVSVQAFNSNAKAYLVQKIKTKKFTKMIKKERMENDRKQKCEELERRILSIVKGKRKEMMIDNIFNAYRDDEDVMKMYDEYQKLKGDK